MSAATALRLHIERNLASRFPAALSPAPRVVREMASTGIDEVDGLLDGGLPIGAISEISGPVCSGRTSLALAFLAQRTAEDRVCAWVDVNDALDPESAAANGVNLRRLLWVRCTDAKAPAAKQPDTHASGAGKAQMARREQAPWSRLDQALRATDLLLQAAGFAAIVLDLGDTAPEHGRRIPLATWFRFRQAADRTRCSLLVLGQSHYAQSSAALALDCSPLAAPAPGKTVLRSVTFQLQRGRQRFTPGAGALRKPPASTWSATGAWEREKQA